MMRDMREAAETAVMVVVSMLAIGAIVVLLSTMRHADMSECPTWTEAQRVIWCPETVR